MTSYREMVESENLANADREIKVKNVTPQEFEILSEQNKLDKLMFTSEERGN